MLQGIQNTLHEPLTGCFSYTALCTTGIRLFMLPGNLLLTLQYFLSTDSVRAVAYAGAELQSIIWSAVLNSAQQRMPVTVVTRSSYGNTVKVHSFAILTHCHPAQFDYSSHMLKLNTTNHQAVLLVHTLHNTNVAITCHTLHVRGRLLGRELRLVGILPGCCINAHLLPTVLCWNSFLHSRCGSTSASTIPEIANTEMHVPYSDLYVRCDRSHKRRRRTIGCIHYT